MGTFSVQIQVGDPSGQRFETIDAMVDSGATYTVLPASLLERLNVDAHATRHFRLADGSRVERRFGRTWLRIDGKADISPVVFWDEEAMPLLGAVTLEILSLGIDPVNRRLIPVDALLLPAFGVPVPSHSCPVYAPSDRLCPSLCVPGQAPLTRKRELGNSIAATV